MSKRSTGIWLVLLLAAVCIAGCIASFAGVWFGAAYLAAWLAILAIRAGQPGWLGVRRRYTVSPAASAAEVAGEPDCAAEGAGDPDLAADGGRWGQPVVALAGAWMAAGLVVARRGRKLVVGLPGGEPAIVRVPRSGTFGGEPFEIFASDRDTVVEMLDVAAPLLGDLRCRIDGEPGEMRFYYVAAGLSAAGGAGRGGRSGGPGCRADLAA